MRDKLIKLIEKQIENYDGSNKTITAGKSSYYHGSYESNKLYTEINLTLNGMFTCQSNYHEIDMVKTLQETKHEDYYFLTFEFDEEPPIEIVTTTTSEAISLDIPAIKKKKWTLHRIANLKLNCNKKIFNYSIHCGHHSYQIDKELVMDLYNKIQDKKIQYLKKQGKVLEDKINEVIANRFQKFNID